MDFAALSVFSVREFKQQSGRADQFRPGTMVRTDNLAVHQMCGEPEVKTALGCTSSFSDPEVGLSLPQIRLHQTTISLGHADR